MKRRGVFLAVAVCAVMALMLSAAQAYETFVGPTGVLKWDKAKAYNGYTLFGPMFDKNVYLIDMEGNVVHKWETKNNTAEYAELLPNGNVLRGAEDHEFAVYFGGSAGIVQELTWDNKVVWEYKLNSPKGLFHHAFDRMPNGNTLILAWEQKSWDEAIAKGRDPKKTHPNGVPNMMDPKKRPTMGIWPDMIQEVNKEGKVVWEWHAWDHIGTGPDQLDINFTLPMYFNPIMGGPDWSHCNTVQYIPEKDVVMLNSRNFGEFYWIDKKTGKIVYRWGNPGAYGKGRLPGGYADDGDQILFGPHHTQMQSNGNITIFDNGTSRPNGNRSRVVEMDPKTNKIVWEFASTGGGFQGNSFYSSFQGAAQKLANGNFLVTSTMESHVFEVTPDKKIVWEFQNPIGDKGPACTREDFQMTYWIHRAYRYAADFPGLKGKDLSPKGPLAPGCPDYRKVLEEGTTKNPK
jgi:hypothetical protein